MIKVTVDGEYERINSTLMIEPELWDVKAMKVVGHSVENLSVFHNIEQHQQIIL